MGFGLQDEVEVDIMAQLQSRDTPEAEKRGALVEEILHRYHLVTLEETGEMLWYNGGVYIAGAEQKILAELDVLGGFLIDNHMRSEVISTIKAKTFRSRTEFDTNPTIINLKNGLLRIDTGEFAEHSWKHLSMVQFPVYYHRTATCPTIMKFLTSTLETEQLRIVVRLLGYLLLKDCRFQRAFMLIGEGANGKSTLLDLLTAFVGQENISSVSLQELAENRFAKAELYNKILNVLDDLKADRIKDTGHFKTLVTGGTIRAERKHQQPFTYRNSAKLVYAANLIPESDDKTKAFYRRWVIIPFNRVFEGEKRDELLLQKLTTEEELSGLLNVAVIGLKRLIAEGGFEEVDIEDIRRQYELGASKIQDFIDECCVLAPDQSVSTADFQSAFSLFCRAKGSNFFDIRELGEKVKALQVEKVRRRRKGRLEYAYEGIGLKAECSYVPNKPLPSLLLEMNSPETKKGALQIGTPEHTTLGGLAS